MFDESYHAQLADLDRRTRNLATLLDKNAKLTAQWRHVRTLVEIARDSLRRVNELHATHGPQPPERVVDLLSYESKMMRIRFEELRLALEAEVGSSPLPSPPPELN